MSQARLPGTLPTPEVARANFRQAQAKWKTATSTLAMREADVTELRTIFKEAREEEGVAAASFAESEELDVEKAFWKAVERVREVGNQLKAARRSRSESRRVAEFATRDYQSAVDELEAIRKGERCPA